MGMSLLISALLLGGADPGEKFSDVYLEKPYDTYLKTNPLLMEVAGAKVIKLPDGRQVILAVASTVLKDNKPRTRLDAEKVCRAKALASVVAEKKGVQVARLEKVEERTVIVIENGKEKARNVSEVLEITKTEVKGLAPGMEVVGRWRSKDGEVFYLALGMIFDPKAKPAPGDER